MGILSCSSGLWLEDSAVRRRIRLCGSATGAASNQELSFLLSPRFQYLGLFLAARNSSILVLCVKLRGFGGSAPKLLCCSDEKTQLARRTSTIFIQEILSAFNSGLLDAETAAERLMIEKTRLYELRHQWLSNQKSFRPRTSGGDHRPEWPAEASQFLAAVLPHSQPLNFALLADELDSLRPT